MRGSNVSEWVKRLSHERLTKTWTPPETGASIRLFPFFTLFSRALRLKNGIPVNCSHSQFELYIVRYRVRNRSVVVVRGKYFRMKAFAQWKSLSRKKASGLNGRGVSKARVGRQRRPWCLRRRTKTCINFGLIHPLILRTSLGDFKRNYWRLNGSRPNGQPADVCKWLLFINLKKEQSAIFFEILF